MSRPLSTWQVVSKALSLLEMTERERRLLSYLIENGSRMGWKSAQPNFYETLAFYMGWNERSVNYAAQALMKRGWVYEWIDKRGVHNIGLTDDYLDVCKRALRHKDARTAIGIGGWAWLRPREADVDAIIARAALMGSGTLINRIKKVHLELMLALDGAHSLAEVIAALPPIDAEYLRQREEDEDIEVSY